MLPAALMVTVLVAVPAPIVPPRLMLCAPTVDELSSVIALAFVIGPSVAMEPLAVSVRLFKFSVDCIATRTLPLLATAIFVLAGLVFEIFRFKSPVDVLIGDGMLTIVVLPIPLGPAVKVTEVLPARIPAPGLVGFNVTWALVQAVVACPI